MTGLWFICHENQKKIGKVFPHDPPFFRKPPPFTATIHDQHHPQPLELSQKLLAAITLIAFAQENSRCFQSENNVGSLEKCWENVRKMLGKWFLGIWFLFAKLWYSYFFWVDLGFKCPGNKNRAVVINHPVVRYPNFTGLSQHCILVIYREMRQSFLGSSVIQFNMP